MNCSGINHDWLGRCNGESGRCVICVEVYKTENYRYGIIRCIAKKEKICIYVIPKCTNYRGNYQAITFKCPAKHIVQVLAWKNKTKKAQNKDNRGITDERSKNRETLVKIYRDRKATPQSDNMELDILIY